MPRVHDDPYASILARSVQHSWTVDEVLGTRPELDLERPFLPEAMTGASELDFLSASERRTLSQLRAVTYARTTAAIEEGILPFVLDELSSRPRATRVQVRALLRFADEEVKHMQLFDRYAAVWEARLGVAPRIAFTREASIAATERSHPLSRALMSAHLEWMTQTHYLAAVKSDDALDPTTTRMLTYHYVEEVQHARIDELIIEAIADACSSDEIAAAVAAYRLGCRKLSRLLLEQARLDLDTLEGLVGRALRPEERDRFVELQHASNTEAFLGSGGGHPRVVAALDRLSR